MPGAISEINNKGGEPGTSPSGEGTSNESPGSAEQSVEQELFNGMDIPEEVKDDPELKELVGEKSEEDSQSEKEEEKETNSEKEEENKKQEEEKGEEKTEEGEEGEKEEEEKGNEEKKEGEDDNGNEEFADTEFADTEIAGENLSADELKNIPEDTLAKISKVKDAVDQAQKEKEGLQQQYQEIMDDPVVKARLNDLENGQEQRINTKLTQEEYKGIEDAIDNGDVDKANSLIEKSIQNRADGYVNEKLDSFKQEQEFEEEKRSAADTLLKLGEFNEDLKLNLDREKFLKIDENNPEYSKYEKGVGKILSRLSELNQDGVIGNVPKYINKMGAEKLYAAFAHEMGWPVAFNTTERDKNIAKSEKEKLLSKFKKAATGEETKKSNKKETNTSGEEANLEDQGGVNKEKTRDPEYIEKLLDDAKSDEEIFEIQEMLKNKKEA